MKMEIHFSCFFSHSLVCCLPDQTAMAREIDLNVFVTQKRGAKDGLECERSEIERIGQAASAMTGRKIQLRCKYLAGV